MPTPPPEIAAFLERLDDDLAGVIDSFAEAVAADDVEGAARIAGLPAHELQAMMPELRRFLGQGPSEGLAAPAPVVEVRLPAPRRWVQAALAAGLLLTGGVAGAALSRAAGDARLGVVQVDGPADAPRGGPRLEVHGTEAGAPLQRACSGRLPASLLLRGQGGCPLQETAGVAIAAGGRHLDYRELLGAPNAAGDVRYQLVLGEYEAELGPLPARLTVTLFARCRPGEDALAEAARGGLPMTPRGVVAQTRIDVEACP